MDANLKKVPLVVYGPEGERRVVGEAAIDVTYPKEEVIIHDTEIWEKLTEGQLDHLSIAEDPASPKGLPDGFTTFWRRPFSVEAVEVTEENFDQIAEMTGVKTEKPDGTPFIMVNRKVVPNVYRIYVGFWLTVMNDDLRAYSAKTFGEMFMTDDEVVSR